MSLSAGDHLGPYEILSPIGAGGMGETQSSAIWQTPSYSWKGMQVFFDLPPGICNVASVNNPQSGDQGVFNQATLFHEALHGKLASCPSGS